MRRVLIVDDNEALRDSLADVLDEEGWSVDLADDTESALAAIGRAIPSVVVLDLTLPGSDPHHIALKITAASGAPVVVLSARADIAQQAERVGAAAYMSKPFELVDFLALLERIGTRE